jgi:hypothetical protein
MSRASTLVQYTTMNIKTISPLYNCTYFMKEFFHISEYETYAKNIFRTVQIINLKKKKLLLQTQTDSLAGSLCLVN